MNRKRVTKTIYTPKLSKKRENSASTSENAKNEVIFEFLMVESTLEHLQFSTWTTLGCANDSCANGHFWVWEAREYGRRRTLLRKWALRKWALRDRELRKWALRKRELRKWVLRKWALRKCLCANGPAQMSLCELGITRTCTCSRDAIYRYSVT